MKKLPLVSIIIPTYNRVDYLLECLESIRNQTHKNIEVIIVSDGGTDSSENAVNSLDDARIFWYNLNVNKGRPAPARNFGLGKASGEFICFCDDDDVWVRDKIEKQVRILRDTSDLTFSGFDVLNDTLSVTARIKFMIVDSYLRITNGRAFYLLAFLNPVCNSSVMVKASALANFRFNENKELRAVEDYVAWISLFKHMKVSYSNRPLVNYRIHEWNISLDVKRGVNTMIHFVQSNKRDFPILWRTLFIVINRIRIVF